MKKTNVVEYSELVDYATEVNGKEWNDNCDLLEVLRLPFTDGDGSYDVLLEDFEDDEISEEYGYDREVRDIIIKFMKEEKIKEMTIVND